MCLPLQAVVVAVPLVVAGTVVGVVMVAVAVLVVVSVVGIVVVVTVVVVVIVVVGLVAVVIVVEPVDVGCSGSIFVPFVGFVVPCSFQSLQWRSDGCSWSSGTTHCWRHRSCGMVMVHWWRC